MSVFHEFHFFQTFNSLFMKAELIFFSLFSSLFLNQSRVDLQCGVSFRCTAK